MSQVPLLTATRLRELLSYDASTGEFRWRFDKGRAKAGSIAGTRDDEGYTRISIDGRRYRAHRLAWLHIHGRWPSAMLDHINGDRSDNRVTNLREATNAQNSMNRRPLSEVGLKGVCYIPRLRKYQADICVGGKRQYLGVYKTASDAYAAYCRAAHNLHGVYARTA